MSMKTALANRISGLVQLTPSSPWTFEKEYIGLIGVLTLAAIVLSFWKLPERLRGPLLQLSWGNAVTGLILLFCRTQEIPFLGMDLWRFIQEVAIVIWLLVIGISYLRHRKQERLDQKVAAYKNKFLPKKKA